MTWRDDKDFTDGRRCSKCLKLLAWENFPKGRGRNGRQGRCKSCRAEYQATYLKREGVADHYKLVNKRRYLANRALINEQQLARHHERKSDPSRRAASRIRAGIRTALLGTRKSAPTFKLLGYSAADLSRHLERQFVPGMGWANASDWHIDHIVPVSAFIERHGNTELAIKNAWTLSNLRPIWARENLQKHARRTHLI